MDSSVSQIIEDANAICQNVNSIKDPSIEVFSENFTKLYNWINFSLKTELYSISEMLCFISMSFWMVHILRL